MIEVVFIFTATILIAASIKMAGAILGNGVTLPAVVPFLPVLNEMSPTHFIYMYPSIAFQVWFWANHAGLFV